MVAERMGCVKLVIDPGALSRPQHAAMVRTHLAKSVENEVIFTDFALQEAFNGANPAGMKRTFAPVKDYAPQIVSLRKTGDIARMVPSSDRLHVRFADELESNRLRAYLHDVFRDAAGVEERVAEASARASKRFEALMPAVSTVREDMMNQLAAIDKADLKQLRTDGNMSKQIADAVVRGVSHDTALHFRQLGFSEIPDPQDVVYSFQLRFILANYVLGLFWGVAGGLQQAHEKKVRNDVTDSTYAAYGTFYDGIVTNDKKLDGVYRNTRNLLRDLFGVPFR